MSPLPALPSPSRSTRYAHTFWPRKLTGGKATGATDSAKTPPPGLLGGAGRTTTCIVPLSGSFTLSLSWPRVPRGIDSDPAPELGSPGTSTNGCGPGQSQTSCPLNIPMHCPGQAGESVPSQPSPNCWKLSPHTGGAGFLRDGTQNSISFTVLRSVGPS